jgi:hypothetical protein
MRVPSTNLYASSHCRSGGNTIQAYQSASQGKSGQGTNSVVGGFLAANVDAGPSVFAAGSSASSTGSSSTGTATGTATAATTTTASSSGSASASAAATTSSSGGTGGLYGGSSGGSSSSSSSAHFGVLPLMFLLPVAAWIFS